MTTTSCTQAEHDALKADPVRFLAETRFIGEMGDEIEMLRLHNCLRCESTLVAAEVIS